MSETIVIESKYKVKHKKDFAEQLKILLEKNSDLRTAIQNALQAEATTAHAIFGKKAHLEIKSSLTTVPGADASGETVAAKSEGDKTILTVANTIVPTLNVTITDTTTADDSASGGGTVNSTVSYTKKDIDLGSKAVTIASIITALQSKDFTEGNDFEKHIVSATTTPAGGEG